MVVAISVSSSVKPAVRAARIEARTSGAMCKQRSTRERNQTGEFPRKFLATRAGCSNPIADRAIRADRGGAEISTETSKVSRLNQYRSGVGHEGTKARNQECRVLVSSCLRGELYRSRRHHERRPVHQAVRRRERRE
jgi:hypothetical protein